MYKRQLLGCGAGTRPALETVKRRRPVLVLNIVLSAIEIAKLVCELSEKYEVPKLIKNIADKRKEVVEK